MAEACDDVLVAHMGLTIKGIIGAQTAFTTDYFVERIEVIIKAGREVNPDIMVICLVLQVLKDLQWRRE